MGQLVIYSIMHITYLSEKFLDIQYMYAVTLLTVPIDVYIKKYLEYTLYLGMTVFVKLKYIYSIYNLYIHIIVSILNKYAWNINTKQFSSQISFLTKLN